MQWSFFLKNFKKCKNLIKISNFNDNDIIIRGLKFWEISKVEKIFTLLNLSASGFGLSKRLLYFIAGRKIIYVAHDIKSNEIVGFDLFYFNDRDIVENTIHEGFIGILPPFQGQGIATKLRRHAIENFRKSRLHGVSTRISESNAASLASAKRLGFKIEESYFDLSIAEIRYYLVIHFKNVN